MGFDETLNAAEQVAAFQVEAEDAQRLQASRSERAREQAKEDTWGTVATVRAFLCERDISFDGRILDYRLIGSYRHRQSLGNSGLLRRLGLARAARLAEEHAIGHWELKTGLTYEDTNQGSTSILTRNTYLGEDGVIYALRGMTQPEWARGIIIADFAYPHGESFGRMENYFDVQQGLANLLISKNLNDAFRDLHLK